MPYHLSDFEVIIDPLIFEITIDFPRSYRDKKNDREYEVSKFDAYTLSVINKYSGEVYTSYEFQITLGLPI